MTLPTQTQQFPLAVKPGTSAAVRRQELDSAMFMHVRNLAYLLYKKPDQTPLMTYDETLDHRGMVKQTILQYELANGWVVPDGTETQPFADSNTTPQDSGTQMTQPMMPPMPQFPQQAQQPQQMQMPMMPPQAASPMQAAQVPQQMMPPGMPLPGVPSMPAYAPPMQAAPPQNFAPQAASPAQAAEAAQQQAAAVPPGKKRGRGSQVAAPPPPPPQGAPPPQQMQMMPPPGMPQQMMPPPQPQMQAAPVHNFAPPQQAQQAAPPPQSGGLEKLVADLGRGLEVVSKNNMELNAKLDFVTKELAESKMLLAQSLTAIHHMYLSSPSGQATQGKANTLDGFQAFLSQFMGNLGKPNPK